MAANWGSSVTIELNIQTACCVLSHLASVLLCTFYIFSTIQNKVILVTELVGMFKLASSASEAKTMFISNITHDLRTPIHAILNLINLIEESDLDCIQRSYLSTMKSSCQHLTSVINNVLDFSKIEKDKMEFMEEEVDLYKLVEGVIDSMAALAEEKNLNLYLDLDIRSPHRYVLSDHKALSRVFTNFLSNSIKFTDKGHIKLKVKCKPHSSTSSGSLLNWSSHGEQRTLYLFEIEDTGRGMTPEFIKHKLFKPFSQESNSLSANKREGTGLGLSLCHQIVQKLGGVIQVQSDVGKGTSFVFSLSLKQSKNPGSLVNLALLRSLMPFQIGTKVCVTDDEDLTLVKMIENEIDDWDDVLAQPFKYPKQRPLSTHASDLPWCIFFLIHSSKDHEDMNSGILDDIGKQAKSAKRRVCYILISRARKDAFQAQTKVYDAMQSHPDSKLVFLLFPLTPLKLHHAISTCVSHIKTIISSGNQDTIYNNPDDASKIDLSNIKVLVAEDNLIIAAVITTFLYKKNIQHDMASNGALALEKWKQNPNFYHILLMDIQMPVMNGFDAVEAIRDLEKLNKMSKPAKIIFMSANASVDEIAHAKKIGGDEYLTKPVDFNFLLKTMQDILQKSPTK
jgi:signal transduction histidine kinase/ActR/RegA family two-component response regulator